VPDDDFRYDHDEPGRLVLHGDLDEGAAVVLRQVVRDATSDLQQALEIDLSDVTFLPSASVGVLATSQAAARRQGADLVFVAADGSVAQRVLRICGLDYVEPGASEPQPG
jgi:anti-anti-sigma factor